MPVSLQVDISDPNMRLTEKLRRHFDHKRRTGIQINSKWLHYWGPVFYTYTIGVGTTWVIYDVLPVLYADNESWLLPMRLLLLFLAMEVAINWCGIRYVDSAYDPSVHGTKPDDFPPYFTEDHDEKNPPTAGFAGLEKVSSSENGDGLDTGSHCGKRNVANEKEPPQSADGAQKRSTELSSSNNGDVNPNHDANEAVTDSAESATTPPKRVKKYDGYSFTMMVATALPTSDGEIERKPYAYWSWVPCLMCQRLRPPRCHHCVLCKQCVLKRDHHCYYTGRCIGLNNTRFFLMFLFWSFCLTSYGTYHITWFFTYHKDLYGMTFVDLVFPVNLFRGMLGYVSLLVAPVVVVYYCIMFCNVISLTMMMGNVYLFAKGNTSFERENSIKVTDTRSVGDRLRAVFGEYWWLNILVPTYPWFKPVEDAVLWPHIKPW